MMLCYKNTDNLAFIIGKPRSGTTWLWSIFANHPDCLAITPEMLGIKLVHPNIETGLFVRGFGDEEIMEKVSRLPKGKLLVEKTPSHMMVLDRIRRVFPMSKIILIRRNSLDVIYSMAQKNPFWKDSPPRTLSDAVNLYLEYARAEAAFKDYDYVLKYETLWRNPVEETNELFKDLNLSTDCTSVIMEKTKLGRTLQPELKTIFRKGTPGQGMQNFTSRDVNLIINKLVELQNKNSSDDNLKAVIRDYEQQLQKTSNAMQMIQNVMLVLEKVINKLKNENNISSQVSIEAGELCFSLKKLDDARYFFQKALSIDPQNDEAINNLGVLSFLSNDYKTAKDLFMKAIELNPDNREAVQNLDVFLRI